MPGYNYVAGIIETNITRALLNRQRISFLDGDFIILIQMTHLWGLLSVAGVGTHLI